MASEVFQLAIFLTLKDAASSGLNRFASNLSSNAGKVNKDLQSIEKRYETLRNELNRDLAVGGVGVAGLIGLKKGIDSAATYEDALFELRKAFQENENASGRSFAEQEKDFNKLVALATEMGGQLAGSSKEYAQIFTALNKSGIDATATINGTGKAVSYLANVTGALRKGTHENLAEDFGSFVKMFSVKGEKELMRMVDMFAAIDDRFNLQSSNLIEGAKYFALTANDAMQLKGFEGAAETMKLMAFMKRFTAREGSIAGTSLDNLIGQYLAHSKAVADLKKQTGISIDFYDDKGQFKGATPAERVKTLFTELEKLQKLNPKERATWTKEIFGEVGFEAATAISSQGLKGYEVINTEMAKSVDVTKQINQQMDTYNAKVEALTGSWENFKASAFTPLMNDAKTFVDYGSKIANALQSFSANNQGLMQTLGTIAAYGSTAMVLYSGFKTASTGLKLFSIANKFSRSEGILPYLIGTKNEAGNTAQALGTATNQAGKFKGILGQIAGSSAVKIGVQVVGIAAAEYALTTIIQRLSDAAEQSQKLAENSSLVKQVYDELAGRGLTYNKPGDYGGRQDLFDKQATEFINSINTRQLEVALSPDKKSWSEFFADVITPTINPYPYSNRTSEYFSPDLAAKKWEKSELTRPLHDPNILARTITQLYQLKDGEGADAKKKFNLGQIEQILKTFELIVGKEKFATAQKIVQNEKITEKKTETSKTVFGENKAFQTETPQKTISPVGTKSFQVGSLTPFFNTSQKNTSFRLPMPTNLVGFKQPSFYPVNPTVSNLFSKQPFSAKPISLASLGLPDFTTLNTNTNALSQSMAELVKQQNQQSQNNDSITSFNQSLQELVKPIPQTSTDIFNLGDSSNKAATPIGNLGTAANGVIGGLNSVSNKMYAWQPPIPKVTTYNIGIDSSGKTVTTAVTGNARGGVVETDGLAYLHAGNIIVPARVSRTFGTNNALSIFSRKPKDIMPADVTRQYRQPQTLPGMFRQTTKNDYQNNRAEIFADNRLNNFQSKLLSSVIGGSSQNSILQQIRFNNFQSNRRSNAVSNNLENRIGDSFSTLQQINSVNSLSPTVNRRAERNFGSTSTTPVYLPLAPKNDFSPEKAFSPSVVLSNPAIGGTEKRAGIASLLDSGRDADRERHARFEEVKNFAASAEPAQITINYSPQVTTTGKGNSEKEMLALLDKHSVVMLNKAALEIDRIMARRMNNGRIRA